MTSSNTDQVKDLCSRGSRGDVDVRTQLDPINCCSEADLLSLGNAGVESISTIMCQVPAGQDDKDKECRPGNLPQ
jgi:hypothetical protein